jgi:hypothetical protein
MQSHKKMIGDEQIVKSTSVLPIELNTLSTGKLLSYLANLGLAV